MSPAKLATTLPVSVPAVSLVTTPESVATPSLLVTAWPANAPSSVKSTSSLEIPWPVALRNERGGQGGSAAPGRRPRDAGDRRRGLWDRQIRTEASMLRDRLADDAARTEQAGLVQDRGVERADRACKLRLSVGAVVLSDHARRTLQFVDGGVDIGRHLRMRHLEPGVYIGAIRLGLGHDRRADFARITRASPLTSSGSAPGLRGSTSNVSVAAA